MATSSVSSASVARQLIHYMDDVLIQFVSATASQPMHLVFNAATNIAHAQFAPVAPSEAAQVGFDRKHKMFIPAYYDDTVVPAKVNKEFGLYHWYICQYNYSGYNYSSLNFVVGNAQPQNPTCQKVDVVRTAIRTGYYKA